MAKLKKSEEKMAVCKCGATQQRTCIVIADRGIRTKIMMAIYHMVGWKQLTVEKTIIREQTSVSVKTYTQILLQEDEDIANTLAHLKQKYG